MTKSEQLLESKGPMMSGILAELLANAEKIPKNTASQKISRDNSIKKIKGFFTSGQAFCYLDTHVKMDDYFEKLIESMYTYGKKYWFCLNAIRMNGGIISKKYLECYTNYPILSLKGHIPFEKVIQNFIDNKILISNADHFNIAPRFHQTVINYSQYHTIELIKSEILISFHTLVRNTGLISYNSGELFAEFGKLRWGLKGVSPLKGLKSNGKFGFLVGDILFGHPIYVSDIQFFLEKIKTIQSFKNSSKLMPILLVDDLHPEALKLIKSNGIIVAFIREFFGEKYAEALKELVVVLSNAGASLKSNPEKYLDLIAQLKQYNEGLANNIKGALFEFVIGHIHSVNSNSSIELGKQILMNGSHDVDVLAIYPQSIVFAECKATKSKVKLSTIEKWLNTKIPALNKWTLNLETYKNKTIEFEFWSISGFDSDAEMKLKEAAEKATKYKISFNSGVQLRERVVKMRNKKLKEAIDNFFLKTEV